MIINYKKSFIKVEEIWGEGMQPEFTEKKDISMNMQLISALPERAWVIKRPDTDCVEIMIPNFLIDVRQEEEDIYKRMKEKSTTA